MESLIGLVNRIQRACTVLGDHGGEGMSLWEALPSVAVVGGQVRAIASLVALRPSIANALVNRILSLFVVGILEFWEIFGA